MRLITIPVLVTPDQMRDLGIGHKAEKLKTYSIINMNNIGKIMPYIDEFGDIDEKKCHVYLTYGDKLECPSSPHEFISFLNQIQQPQVTDGVPMAQD
jgi:hypothetical protein